MMFIWLLESNKVVFQIFKKITILRCLQIYPVCVRRANGYNTNPYAKCIKIKVDLKMKLCFILNVCFVVVYKYIGDLKTACAGNK